MRLKRTHRMAPATLAATLIATAMPALALDYSGYFRAGPGFATESVPRACYGLNGGGSGLKYRLGNECDFYGEFQLSKGFKQDGIDYRATLMLNQYTPATDTNGTGVAIEQMWAEAKGFDVAPNATFWMGKQRGRRGDVHIVDTFFIDMAGVGAGFNGQPAGPGKFGLAVYKTDKDAKQPGNRFNVEYVGVPTGADGSLNFFATATKGDFATGTNGFGFTVRHDQAKLFGTGLNNSFWVQYAQGSTALNANFGDLTAGSEANSWRIVETFNWQDGALGGQVMALLARERNGAGLTTDSASLGGRVSYAFTQNFKLVTELGFSQYKPDGGKTAQLTKLTIAPTLSIGPGFWSRPEFRLYVTTAQWNTAAGNVTGHSAFDNKTSGTSYGAQVEWWF